MSNELTPETDALVSQFLSGGEIPDIFAHARKLERERNNFKAFLQQGSKGQKRIAESNKFLMRELIAARKERDEWAAMCGRYKQERDEAREIIADSLKALPVGYIPTHTPDSVPERIADLVATIVERDRERDEAREHLSAAKHFLNKYIAERDEAREVVKEADAGHDMAIADLAKCEAAADKVIARAKELIVRWDAPSWKDTTPTIRYIDALRIAVRAYENKQQITDQT